MFKYLKSFFDRAHFWSWVTNAIWWPLGEVACNLTLVCVQAESQAEVGSGGERVDRIMSQATLRGQTEDSHSHTRWRDKKGGFHSGSWRYRSICLYLLYQILTFLLIRSQVKSPRSRCRDGVNVKTRCKDGLCVCVCFRLLRRVRWMQKVVWVPVVCVWRNSSPEQSDRSLNHWRGSGR